MRSRHLEGTFPLASKVNSFSNKMTRNSKDLSGTSNNCNWSFKRLISPLDPETLCSTCPTKTPCFREIDLQFLVGTSRIQGLPKTTLCKVIKEMAVIVLEEKTKKNWKILRDKWVLPTKGGLTTFRRSSSKSCVKTKIRFNQLLGNKGLSSLSLKKGIHKVRMFQRECLRQ